jgi:hypothetical protein
MADETGATSRVRIAISGWSRTVSLVKGLFLTLFAIGFLTIAAQGDSGGNNQALFEDMSRDEVVAVRVTFLVLGLACLVVAWLYVRPGITRKAYMELGPDSLVIHHPGLLKGHLVVPRDFVRAAAIDPRPWRWRWVGNKGRFHLTYPSASGQDSTDESRQPAERPEWLSSVIGGSPFPMLSNVDDTPNVAFVFTEPVRLRNVRRAARMFASKNPVHLPIQGRDARGLLVKVKDARSAEGPLSAWTVVRPLTVDDVTEVEPDKSYERRVKRRRRVANTCLGVLLFVQFGIPAINHIIERA